MRLLLIIATFLYISCKQEKHANIAKNIVSAKIEKETKKQSIINTLGKTIKTRFNTPNNFIRTEAANNSFANYLRELPLKNHGTEVKFYNGQIKPNYNVYTAVVDLPIGKKDLHQCADAVMRLRAEYLWKQKRYNDIHFNFTNGFRVDYHKYKEGNRVVVKGNKTYWIKKTSPSNTYKNFWNYMELIFTYAGTLSLSKELTSIKLEKIKIGDVLIQGGSPGHAVIVVDMCINPSTKEKAFLLAQSYMPAQETQILKNRAHSNNPWYSLNDIKNRIETPEWTFTVDDLKRFE
ncbi:DUF4846 domain-containing protein [Pseudofulvibacter geojedonensis]|uniref:DUF4846 domain-containing protein n=1 Tax=Pseudofulvibacter geojedonensis TaxID=1123758 RepID=A0ABW3HZW8_9FLAO